MECVCALVPRIVEVLGLSERILDAAARDASLAGLRGAALRAALAWLRLDEDNVGGCALSPGQLSRCRAGLLRRVHIYAGSRATASFARRAPILEDFYFPASLSAHPTVSLIPTHLDAFQHRF